MGLWRCVDAPIGMNVTATQPLGRWGLGSLSPQSKNGHRHGEAEAKKAQAEVRVSAHLALFWSVRHGVREGRSSALNLLPLSH